MHFYQRKFHINLEILKKILRLGESSRDFKTVLNYFKPAKSLNTSGFSKSLGRFEISQTARNFKHFHEFLTSQKLPRIYKYYKISTSHVLRNSRNI